MVRRSSDQEPAARRAEDKRAARMAAAQRGDAAAYESLLLSLLAPLRGFVRGRGVDAGEVEDVVQEIVILIHRARHTWRADRPFDPWMWAIARNASTDALRRLGRERARRGREPERTTGDGEAPLASALDAASGALDPEALLAARELTPELADALAQLPDGQRQAVELLYLEQLPVSEAAARAGVSASALKVRAHRGSRALRRALLAGERR
jgi:RNA polymerase sigma factor (sigma-70 family)